MDNSFGSLIYIERWFGEYYCNAKIRGIEFVGEYYTNSIGQSVPNILEAITFYAPIYSLSGNVYIQDCYIENSFEPIGIVGLKNSMIDISHNTFVNSLVRGVKFFHNKYINVKISHNIGVNSGIIGFYGSLYTYSNNFLIDHNEATNPIDGWVAAIEVWDDIISPEKSSFVIVSNRIHSEDSLASGPIWMYGVDNALIANNIITGTGPSAIYIGVDPMGVDPISSGLMIRGNNLEGWQVTDYDGFWGSVQAAAPIWLGSGATNCIVIGNARHNVADDGIDNILLGVDKIQGPIIGQETKEMMELKKSLITNKKKVRGYHSPI